MLIGGSYPGAVVAWYQQVYGDAAAIWSSSGVIHAIENYLMFDYDIYEATHKSKWCSDAVEKLTASIDKAFYSGKKEVMKKLLKAFNTDNEDIVQGDFMFYIADIFTMGVQYGTRTEMCELLTSKEFYKDPWKNLYEYGVSRGLDSKQYDAKYLRNTTYYITGNLRQWTYQYCTEFGWFQEPNTVHPLRSKSLSQEFWLDYCKRIFSPDLAPP